jgi:hypothetical protein
MEDRLHELRELTDTELAEVAGGTGCGCNGDGNALVNVEDNKIFVPITVVVKL